MKRTIRITPGAWLTLAIGVMVFAAAWILTRRVYPIRRADDSELTALVAEREQFRDASDAMRDALRRQVRELGQRSWTSADLDTFREKLGSGWTWESRATGLRGHQIRIVCSHPRLDAWPAYLALLDELAGRPGLAVESLDIGADGTRHHRRFTRFALGLRVIVADASIGKAEQPAFGAGPLPLAPGGMPATTRPLESVPSRSRPSASAEPPASGPVSAPSRPEPPGPRAGIE